MFAQNQLQIVMLHNRFVETILHYGRMQVRHWHQFFVLEDTRIRTVHFSNNITFQVSMRSAFRNGTNYLSSCRHDQKAIKSGLSFGNGNFASSFNLLKRAIFLETLLVCSMYKDVMGDPRFEDRFQTTTRIEYV